METSSLSFTGRNPNILSCNGLDCSFKISNYETRSAHQKALISFQFVFENEHQYNWNSQ